MCLMESYINIDNECFKEPRDISDEMNTGNVLDLMLCSFRVIIHVCNDSHKTFLNARFFITDGLLCITKMSTLDAIILPHNCFCFS